MVHRRSNRPATEFTKGLNRIDGPSLTATTAATTRWPTSAEESAVKITAREISASRLNQSPRLDRESEIHNLRKDVIARTLCASVGAPRGADLLIALKIIDEGGGERGAQGPTGSLWGRAGTTGFSVCRRAHTSGREDHAPTGWKTSLPCVTSVCAGAGGSTTALVVRVRARGEPIGARGCQAPSLPFGPVFGSPVFLVALFLAAVFAVVVFVVFLAAVFFLAGALARRSASNSAARRSLTDSTSSPLRSEALVCPSVT